MPANGKGSWSVEEDNAIREARGQMKLADFAKSIGRSRNAIMERVKVLGFPKWRVPSGRHAGRKVAGFNKGNPVYEHRAVAADMLGRELTSEEIVHHIDFDKDNNSRSNLHIHADRAAHRRCHMSFEALVPELMRRGIIAFNPSTETYEIAQ